MKFFTVLGIAFYATVLILIGIVLILFSVKLLPPQQIYDLLNLIQESTNYRAIIFLSGILIILVSYSFAQLILGRFQREKTIAFTTSSGQVTIALSAIEDLIRQLTYLFSEIKELKPDVIATKRGIIVQLRVVLKSEANLPELTARLQDITKTKIQEVLGVEEDIIIKIHIAKIITREEKERKRKETDKEEHTIPYGGYGRI